MVRPEVLSQRNRRFGLRVRVITNAWRRFAHVPALAVVMLAFAGYSTGQESEEPLSDVEWRKGYHGFAVICSAMGYEVQTDLNAFGRLPPEESLIVAFGDVSRVNMNLNQFLGRGGALLVASDRGGNGDLRQLGIGFQPGPFSARNPSEAFDGIRDCPLVSWLDRSHPSTNGINAIATNRPGGLQVNQRVIRSLGMVESTKPIAFMPSVRSSNGRPYTNQSLIFAHELQLRNGVRAMFVADQSIFSNQMIVLEDNARFTQQTLEWLAEFDDSLERRKYVIIISDRAVLPDLNPSSVEVTLPPPDPADVMRALKNLPPDVLVDFGNSVIAAIEDEGVVNELLSRETARSRNNFYRRFILITLALICGLILIWKLLFGTSMHDRWKQSTRADGEPLDTDMFDGCYERFLASHELLREFQNRTFDRLGHLTEATIGTLFVEGSRSSTRQLRAELRLLARQLRRFNPHEWTEKNFGAVEKRIERWQAWYDAGQLVSRPMPTR